MDASTVGRVVAIAIAMSLTTAPAQPDRSPRIRIAHHAAANSSWRSAVTAIGPLRVDVVCVRGAGDDSWCRQVASVLGLPHWRSGATASGSDDRGAIFSRWDVANKSSNGSATDGLVFALERRGHAVSIALTSSAAPMLREPHSRWVIAAASADAPQLDRRELTSAISDSCLL